MNTAAEVSIFEEYKITAVVVTYGDRWNFLEKLLSLLQEEKLVRDVVVVDNASKEDIRKRCHEQSFHKVLVVRQKRNLGSAGGYRVGLEQASKLPAELIMLFDDDVVPRRGAIPQLVNCFSQLANERPIESFAITAFRESQHGNVWLPKKRLFMVNHDFLGLNLFNFFQRHFPIKRQRIHKSCFDVVSHCGGTAYAGLVFHQSLLDSIGLPREDLIVYFDDVEFTSRILREGGEIWLEVGAVFDDICENYSVGVVTLPFFGCLLADSDTKVYYLIRNWVFIDRYVHYSISVFYIINMVVFFFVLLFLGIFTIRLKRVCTIIEAVINGLRGKLGRHGRYTLS